MDAVKGLYELDRQEDIIPLHAPLGDWLKREFPRHDLFLCFIKSGGNWVIASPAPFGRIVEHQIIGPALGQYNGRMANELKRMLLTPKSEALATMRRQARAAHSYERTKFADEAEQSKDYWRHMQRTTGSVDPVLAAMAGTTKPAFNQTIF